MWNGLDFWDQHPAHTHADWRDEVANGDTLLGYHAWVNARLSESR